MLGIELLKRGNCGGEGGVGAPVFAVFLHAEVRIGGDTTVFRTPCVSIATLRYVISLRMEEKEIRGSG